MNREGLPPLSITGYWTKPHMASRISEVLAMAATRNGAVRNAPKGAACLAARQQ